MMAADHTAAERKRSERERKRASGLMKVEVWVEPKHADKIRQLAAELRGEWESAA